MDLQLASVDLPHLRPHPPTYLPLTEGNTRQCLNFQPPTSLPPAGGVPQQHPPPPPSQHSEGVFNHGFNPVPCTHSGAASSLALNLSADPTPHYNLFPGQMPSELGLELAQEFGQGPELELGLGQGLELSQGQGLRFYDGGQYLQLGLAPFIAQQPQQPQQAQHARQCSALPAAPLRLVACRGLCRCLCSAFHIYCLVCAWRTVQECC